MINLPDGFHIDLQGQEYRFAGAEHYTNDDGKECSLLVWDTHCAACQTAMQAKTTLKFKHPNRRCDRCKCPGMTVRNARKAVSKAIRKEVRK